MTGLQNILFSDDLSKNGQWNLSYYGDSLSFYNDESKDMKDLTYNLYLTAKDAYDVNLTNYKAINRYSEREEIENLVLQTYNTTRDISDVIKSVNNLIQLYQEEYFERNLTPETLSNTHLSSLSSYTSSVNNILSNLLSVKNSIKNKKEDIIDAGRSIEEKTKTLAKLKEGTDEYDLRSANISISQKENWSKFKEAHQLMLNGDRQGAQAIFEEIGIERGVGMRSEMGLMHGGKGLGMKGEKLQENINNN